MQQKVVTMTQLNSNKIFINHCCCEVTDSICQWFL